MKFLWRTRHNTVNFLYYVATASPEIPKALAKLLKCRYNRGMPEIRTVTTLIGKRDEIEAAITNYERRLEQARVDLAHVNAVISIFRSGGRSGHDHRVHGYPSLVRGGRAGDDLQGRTSRARADEYAGVGDAYPRSEGDGRRRPRVGEVGRGAAHSRTADAGEAGEDHDCGERTRGDRLVVRMSDQTRHTLNGGQNARLWIQRSFPYSLGRSLAPFSLSGCQ